METIREQGAIMACLQHWADVKAARAAELLRVLKANARIAENMEDYWKHLNSGAEQ